MAADIFDTLESKTDIFDELDAAPDVQDIPLVDAQPAPAPPARINPDEEAAAITALGQQAASLGLEPMDSPAAQRQADRVGIEFATREADFLKRFPQHPYSLRKQGQVARAAEERAQTFPVPSALDSALQSPERFIDRMGFNALPLAGALGGARLLTARGLQPLAQGASFVDKVKRGLTHAAPIGGMVAGGGLAGLAQEKLMSAAETEAETAARHEEQARLGETPEGKLADLATMGIVARPSLTTFERALAGDAGAQMSIGGGAGLGGALTTANAAMEGRLPSSKELATGFTEGALFSTPTKLGARLMGHGPQKTTAAEARQDVQENVLNVQGVLPESRMPTVSAEVPLIEGGLTRQLTSGEAFIVATQGLDALQTAKESGTLEAGYREAAKTPKTEILFHQSAAKEPIIEFKDSGSGMTFFSTRKDVLSQMIKAGASKDITPASQVVKAEVTTQNPLDIRKAQEPLDTSAQYWEKILTDAGVEIPQGIKQKIDNSTVRHVPFWHMLQVGGVELKNAIQKAGYDAVKFDEWGGTTTGIFDPAKASVQSKKKPSLEQIRQQGTTPPDPNRKLGPGAANIEEPLQTFTTSNKEAVVNAERAAIGQDPVIKEARISNAESIDRAETLLESNPTKADEIVTKLRTDPQTREISLEDSAVLLVNRASLKSRQEQAMGRLLAEDTPPGERLAAEEEFQFLDGKLAELDQAAQDARSTWGRFGQLWQRSMRSDMTLEPMLARSRIAKGEPLTVEETQQIQQQAQTIQKADAARAERTAEVDEAQSAQAAQQVINQESRYHPKVLEYAEGIVSRWEAEAVKAKADLMQLFGMNLSANPFQTKAIAALVKMARAKIARGALNAADFATEMVQTFGDKVKPFVQPAWDKAQKFVTGLDATKRPKTKKQIAKEEAGAKEAESTEAGIAAAVTPDTPIDALKPYVKRLAKDYIKAGENTVEGLQTKLHDFFSKIVPDVTPRQLRDIFSDYGTGKPAPTDPVRVTQAQLRSESQKLSALDDLEKQLAGEMEKTGVPPSGDKRVPQSDRARSLTKKINELKKELGIVEGDPAKRLSSALESMETRTSNRIRDLKFEIAKGERTVKQKGEPPTSPKLEALRKELAEVQREHEAVFGKREITPEQKLKAAISAAERAEKAAVEELQNARKGIFKERPTKGTADKAVEAIRARVKAAREETNLLRKLANPPMSDAQKALDKAMVARERWEQVLAGEIGPAKKVPREALTQLEEDARLEIEAMRKLAAEMRQKPRTSEEERTLKALEKSTAEYERRLNDADFGKRQREQNRPEVERVAKARAVRDAAKAAFDAARKAAGPPKRTAEEIAIQTRKTQLAKRIADYAERTAMGDFEKKPRKVLDVSKDPEAVRLKAEADTAKREFEKRQFEWEQAKRSKIRKGWDALMDTAAASRSLITSADVSAPLRQGGFLLLGDLVTNPARAARQIGSMFKQLVSEKGFAKEQAKISLRPNAPLYESSKLYLSDLNSKLSAREEAMRSTLAEKIPGIGRIVRASNRAYTGFLNRQRVDAFDAMVEAAGGRDAITPEGAKLLADAVNAMTGRGTAFGAEKLADMAAKYLFSPRFLVSRFQTVLGEPIWNLRKGRAGGKERAIIAQQYLKFAAGLSALWGLATLMGGKVEKDPRSSDAGKIRIGNTRIDPMAGLQQVTRIIAQSLPKVGKVKTTEGKFRDTDASTYGNFFRSKMAPIPGTLLNLKAGKNVIGEPVTPLSALRDISVPISFQEVPSIYRAHGPVKGTLLEALNLLGAGVNTYEPHNR